MQNKIVYIGDYTSGTGYSESSNRTILGLDSAGLDIIPRSLKLASQYVKPPEKILELEKKSSLGAKIVIQHLLAPLFSYIGGFRNIGYFHLETTHMRPSGWQFYANLMDEIWVCSEQNRQACIDSGVTKPIKVVPIPADMSAYSLEYPQFDFGNRYKFYHIGDYSTRKNTENLIKCYLEEFSRDDNVVLILKTYVESTSPQESFNIISNEIKKLKESLRKGPEEIYPPIIIIPDYLSTNEVYGIHQSCDCFISLERAAAWNLPAFDAAGFGKWVIVNGWGGQTQFIKDQQNGTLLSYRMRSVYGMTRSPYQNLYTCHEKWAEPDLEEAKLCMRAAYEKNLVPKNGSREIIESFDIKNFGKFLEGIL